MKQLLSRICFLLPLIATFLSCAAGREIRDIPIMFNEERTTLSLEYLQERYGLEREEPTIIPRMIVLHHTVIPSLKDSFKTFNAATLPENRGEIKGAGRLNVSSHFLVDRDGSIYRLMPETLMARHVIGLNHCAIGVENVGGTEELPLTPRQVRANIWLVRYLAAKYEIDYLIGHHEYQYFQGHALWLEKDDGYRTVKDDPGKEFMGKVRKAVKNLNFMPVPKTNAL